MSPYKRNVLVGATVLGGGIIIGWMLLEFSGRAAEVFAPPQMPVRFIAPRADGLSEGSAVEYLGVSVGQVVSLHRSSEGVNVEIEAQVDREPPMPANVHAEITQPNAIGGASIISMDVDGQQPRGSLQPRAVIPAEYVGLKLLPPSLSNAAGQIGAMSEEIRKTAQQWRETDVVDDLDKTIKTINVQVAKAGAVMDSIQAVLGDDKTQESLKVAIANIRSTSEATSRIAGKLDALTDSLQRSSDNASVAVKDAQSHIDELSKQVGDRLTQVAALLASVQSITEKIDKGQGTAGQFVNDPKLYQALVDSSRELNATVADLKRLLEQWEQEGVTLRLK
jgi:ABC-type transporter Mla subunit MlaD